MGGQAARLGQLFLVALRLGLTSFGGPVAHLGYFRDEYVQRRQWLDDRTYGDLVALCQALPGPASSQVGIAVGIHRAGMAGGLAAWAGFTLPSAVALVAFAYGVVSLGDRAGADLLHGLKVVAVPVVALAVWGMGRSLCPDRARLTLAVAGAVALIVAPGVLAQIGVIGGGGVAGLWLLRGEPTDPPAQQALSLSRRWGAGALALFALLLGALPVLSHLSGEPALAVLDSFYRAGSLVFGGGHVVLPLLQAEVVPPGWVTQDRFLAGYGAAQAVPGPLFTFAGFLGASMDFLPARWLGGLLALGAIFLPSFLLVTGVLPFWELIRSRPLVRRALMGTNAAVVGLLLAALYDPVWTSTIEAPEDAALALAGFVLLAAWRVPPWMVVGLSALGGAAIAAV